MLISAIFMNRRNFLIKTAIFGSALLGGVYYWPNRWRYIVIHHSAGSYGNIEFLQRVHKERTKGTDLVEAIAYHYVIGNGNGMNMGEVASDKRMKYNLWGSHVSARNMDRNLRGIGICLIGNFELRPIPTKQYAALVQLTKQLMKEYHIPPQNVVGHGKLTGEYTLCPGKYFPIQQFLNDIAAV